MNNMSEYQKLIFVNNINEDDSIKQLSRDYPFAVFFTVKNDNVHNIWNDGVRLTRFVGVDSFNNTIKVGGHELKLKFDYDSGLLGIIDTNKLKEIKLVSIQFNSLNNDIVNLDTLYHFQNIIINAKDNKFKLGVKFYYDNIGELSEESNVLKITPTLSFNNDISKNYFSVISNPVFMGSEFSESNTTEYPDIAKYEYNCIINYESHDENNDGFVLYNIISQYDEEKRWPLGIKFYLNPISYTIYHGNNVISNSSIITLENNKTYTNFRIEIKPNNGELYSYPKNYESDRPLKLKLESTKANVADIDGDRRISIENGTVNFTIKTFEPANNSTDSSVIKLCISDNGVDILQQNFTINLNGSVNNCYYYAGFTDPTSSTFNGLVDFSSINYTGNVLWDWENHISEVNSNNDKYFYIAIPYTFRNSILPCCDAYIMQGNTPLYIEVKNRFTTVICESTHSDEWPADYNGSGIGGKNISMIIYRSTNKFHNTSDAKGLFYGKIQIQ